ncbi:MAG: amino acid permease [Chitinivibrionales bacterium]|nr:amino acid permease [Chitinivibrionales bacterium]
MPQKGKLKKQLGVIHVFAIASGAMISSGLFVLPGLAHAQAGPAVICSYLFAGLLAAIGTMSIAELTTAMPKAGGDYFFIMRSFGPGVGSITGLLSWFSLSLKSAFAIAGMTAFVSYISPDSGIIVGAILCVLFTMINLAGVHQAARIQLGLMVAIYILLILYIVIALPRMQPERLQPFVPHGWGKVFMTTGFVFIAYGGLLKVAGIAEETRDPGRSITLGMLFSLITVTLFYTIIVLVTSAILPSGKLNDSLMPISHGGRVLMGEKGFIAMSLTAVLAFISTANAGIMSASRYLLALSRDNLLPRNFSRINNKFGTPHIAIITTGAVILISLFLPLKILVEAASTVLILTFVMSCFSVIILRQSGIHNYRPQYQAPLYPWLQITGIIGFGFLLFEMGWHAYLISVILILSGFLIYWFYGRKFVEQEYALLHILQNLTDRTLVTGSLEEELKEIIRERDHIEMDRVDCLIERAHVLDIKEHMAKNEFFRKASKRLAPHLDITEDKLAELLLQREKENSTVLNPSLAVPHIVIPGEKKFQLLLARARKGVAFTKEEQHITSIFTIIGTPDERNFYLRVLAAIVEVFQAKDFDKRWMTADTEQGLRDILLLSERNRNKKGKCS